MITRCPFCGYLYSTEWGCPQCNPKEAYHQKPNVESMNVEEPTGEDMPSPAGQMKLNLL